MKKIFIKVSKYFGDVEKVFELSEKSKRKNIDRANLLYDVESSSKKKFTLSHEYSYSNFVWR